MGRAGGRAVERVDYDRIAPTYDARYTENERSGTGAALCALVERRAARQVLEVGCGTGHWLQELQRAGTRRTKTSTPRSYDVLAYGLDLSRGMLRQAHARAPSLGIVRGRASELSFAGASFDLIYCVNAIHHFGQPRVFVSEACRTLRPGGTLAVIGMDPHGQADKWYVYRYFEGVYETDLRRFPPWGTVMDWMSKEGLVDVTCRVVEQFESDLVGRTVLEHPFLRKDSCSQLALLSDEAYAAGLRRIEAAIAEAEAAGREIAFPYEMSLAMISGQLPEGR
jgi:ubiquinone/menaquinone biosynthesis C-methylase UbiE